MSEMVYNFPLSINFGWGEVENIIKYLDDAKDKRILIVTDNGIREAGLLNRIERILAEGNVNYFIFDGVQPNPTYINVYDGLSQFKQHRCNTILALGGGSPMDAAKGILLMSRHKGELRQYFRGEPNALTITDNMPQFIAVPTTSGTGSESSRGAIITDETNRKRSIGSPYLLPKTVILDPELTEKMPPKLTAYTGLDALSHSLEAIAVDRYAPICDALAVEGIKLVTKSLVKVFKDGSNKEARMDMMMASTMGALAFMKGLGVIHSLAHQLSTQRGIPHGAACGIMTPHAIKFNLAEKSTQSKYTEVSRILSGRHDATANEAPGLIEDLLDTLGVERSLRRWGVTDEDIPTMSENAMLDHCHPRNPRACSNKSMMKLYEEAM
jgi:4-hydroxybutyrate dehydrogenase